MMDPVRSPTLIPLWILDGAGRKTRAALVALVAATACSSQPMPLAAPAGSTIAIPVSGEVTQEVEIGYGSDLLAAVGRYDLQRGELQFHFAADADPADSFTVSPRAITRMGPDPASRAAQGNQEFFIAGLFQVIALLDIPAAAQAGDYVIEIRRCRRSRPGEACTPLSPDLPYSQPFTVLPGSGSPNPSTGIVSGGAYDTEAAMRELYPYPKVVLRYTAAQRAASAVVAYPTEKMAIKMVFEEQYGESRSIMSWADDPATGSIRIDSVDPTGKMRRFAIAFELKEPPPGVDAARVTLEDIEVLSVAAYDLNGQPVTASLEKLAIR